MDAGVKRQRGGDGNRENKPGYQLEMLRSKAQGADQAGNKDAAVKLWQQVLQIEPRDYQASRAGEGDAFCRTNSQLPVYLADLPHASALRTLSWYGVELQRRVREGYALFGRCPRP